VRAGGGPVEPKGRKGYRVGRGVKTKVFWSLADINSQNLWPSNDRGGKGCCVRGLSAG